MARTTRGLTWLLTAAALLTGMVHGVPAWTRDRGAGRATGAGKPWTPKPGSPERKALLDALRPSVERELGQKVVFRPKQLAVQGDWAFFYGDPQRPDGKPVDYSRTKFREEVKAGMFGGGIGALLRKRRGQWRVVRSVIGPTDVAWEGWDRRYGAPSAIFQMK